MSRLEEHNPKTQGNSNLQLSEASAAHSPENYADGRHPRTWNFNSDSADHTDFTVPGVIPHCSGGECSGYGTEARSSRMDHHCTNYQFYTQPHDAQPSLHQYQVACHGDLLLPQSNPFNFISPLLSFPNNHHFRSLGGHWTSEGPVHCNLHSGEVVDTGQNICPDTSDDNRPETYSQQQDALTELMPQNQVDINQSVMCIGNGRGQMVLMNNCSPGRMLHSHTPGHLDYIPDTTFYDISFKENLVQTTSLRNDSQSYRVPLSLLAIQPDQLVSSEPHGSGNMYNLIPTPFSQYQQYPRPVYSMCLVPEGQSTGVVSLSESQCDSKSKKPCNCTKSQCLKLYCDCFANGDICSNCNCINCCNNTEHELERFNAIKLCLDRKPEAFRHQIGNKGCNCKRSACLKNYCECFEAKIKCSSTCKCVGCRNYKDSPERNTLLLHSPDKNVTCGKEKCPLSCITLGVVEATCGCLLAQAEKAEKEDYTLVQAEKMILEEFAQCLTSIFKSIGL